MWWAVQTLTSLGYGDFAPTTFLGKVELVCYLLVDFTLKRFHNVG